MDAIISIKITYDPVKCVTKNKERGLSIDLARDLDWDSAIITEDTRKDYGERRFRVFGHVGERLFALVFTPRGDSVRVISFRKANRQVIKRYG